MRLIKYLCAISGAALGFFTAGTSDAELIAASDITTRITISVVLMFLALVIDWVEHRRGA